MGKIFPQHRFFFGYVRWTEGEGLTTTGDEAGWADGGYSTTYIDIRYVRSFKTSYVAACSGIFYDDRQQMIDYFGYAAGAAHNCTATGIVTVPTKARYIRVNMPTDQRTAGTAYVGTEDGKDNWIEWRKARPNYSTRTRKVWEMQSDERFFRATLSEKLTFIKNDYQYIKDAAFDKVFHVILEKSNDNGKTWFEYYHGKFSKTDAEFDLFDRKIVVGLTTVDAYDAVLAGMENEYNLIELAPEIERVAYTKRPLVQLYVPGEDIVSCLLGGMYWEQSAEKVTDEAALTGTYHFAQVTNIIGVEQISVSLKGEAIDDPNNLDGNYRGVVTSPMKGSAADIHLVTVEQATFRSETNRQARIEYLYTRRYDVSSALYTHRITYNMYDGDTLSYAWVFQPVPTATDRTSGWIIDNYKPNGLNGFLSNASLSPYPGTAQLTFSEELQQGAKVYGRILFDTTNMTGFTIPTEDIVDNNRNYRFCASFIGIEISVTDDASQEATQWGRRPDGLYYTHPVSSAVTGDGGLWSPIGQSRWGQYSMWTQQSNWIADKIEEIYRAPAELPDAYPLWSCIDVLLRKIAPGIRHRNTAEYSNFLYGTGNTIKDGNWQLYVTQVTNLKHSYYSQAAQRADITLKQIMDMLRDALRCYWYIDGNRLRIEHVEWFRNGGSYNPADHVIGFDLTKRIYTRNGRPETFGLDQYTFDKEEMPERYEFGWSQQTTTPFDGYPMEILSNYVKAGKTERVSVGNFITDIDYILLNPEDVSDEGLVLMAVEPNDDPDEGAATWKVPIVNKQYVIDDAPAVKYIMQNGYLSFVNLVPTYYIYDMPATRALINTQLYRYGASGNYAIKGVKRTKKQEITFASLDDPTLTRLLRTDLGDGEIQKLTINIEYRTTDAIVAYDIE